MLFVAMAWVCLAGPAFAANQPETDARQQIQQIIADQAAAWNKGDLDAFMAGYAELPDLRFASGGTVTYGWQETLDRYKQHYPDRAAMGALTFSDLDIEVLAPDAALALWTLEIDDRQRRAGRFVHAALAQNRRGLAHRGGSHFGRQKSMNESSS